VTVTALRSENIRLAAAIDTATAAAQQDVSEHQAALSEMATAHNKIVNRMQRENAKASQQLVLAEAEAAQLRVNSSEIAAASSRRIAALEGDKAVLEKRAQRSADECTALLRELKAAEKKAAVALATFEDSLRGQMNQRLTEERAAAESAVRSEYEQRLRQAECQHSAIVASTVAQLETHWSAAVAAQQNRVSQLLHERDAVLASGMHSARVAAGELETCQRRTIAQVRDCEAQEMLLRCVMEGKLLRQHQAGQRQLKELHAALARVAPRQVAVAHAGTMCETVTARVHYAGTQTAALPCRQCAALEGQLRDVSDELARADESVRALRAENSEAGARLEELQSERENMLRTIRNLKESLALNEQNLLEVEEEASAKIEAKRCEARQLVEELGCLKDECHRLGLELDRCRRSPPPPVPTAAACDEGMVENLRRAVEALRAQLVSVNAALVGANVEKAALARQCADQEATLRHREAEHRQTLQEHRSAWEMKLQSLVTQALNRQ
jgi:chromosome segregation ATPase